MQSKVGVVSVDVHARKIDKPDLLSRLKSIHLDSCFVEKALSLYFPNYAVFANLRNGLWYMKGPVRTCYFKSTDGHESTHFQHFLLLHTFHF